MVKLVDYGMSEINNMVYVAVFPETTYWNKSQKRTAFAWKYKSQERFGNEVRKEVSSVVRALQETLLYKESWKHQQLLALKTMPRNKIGQ